MSVSDNVNSHTPGRPGDSCVMVIFGATGDLTQRKLLPALYNLAKAKLLSSRFAIVGTSVEAISPDEFKGRLIAAISEYDAEELDRTVLSWFEERIHYIPGDVRDPEFYQGLKGLCSEVRNALDIEDNHFYYLATAPDFFGEIVQQLGKAGLATEAGDQWRRVIIEKPFGHDLESAKELNIDINQLLM